MTAIQLRDYQQNAIASLRRSYAAGHKSVLFALPTGGGKTFTFAYVASQSAAKGGTCLILVHRQELLKQASRSLDKLGVSHGLIAPGCAFSPRKVQVASVQTLVRRMHKLPWRPDLIIIDEAHHAVAGSWRRVLAYYPEARVLGVTATPCRTDGLGLGEVFSDLVIGPSIADLTAQGFLTPTKIYAPPLSVDLSGVRSRGGDYAKDDLQKAIDRPAITGDAVAHYRRICPGAPAIAFCVSVEHAKHVANQFREIGFRAQSLDGAMADDDRARAIDDLGLGRLDVLTSCDIVSEGTDIPVVTAALLLRPTQSEGLYLQQCLDDETEVLTTRGWLRRLDVTETDTVAAFDTDTGAAAWCPVIRKTERALAAGEQMYAIRSPHLDIRVTGGHDMIVRARSKTTKQWRKETAAESAARRSMFKIPVTGVLPLEDAPLTDDEVRFIGWFLTDGTKNARNGAVTIAQSAAKTEHLAEIRRVLTACGFKFGEYRAVRRCSMAGYPDLIAFTVSRGNPRGTDKHLRGWIKLEPWLDKSIGAAFDALSARQMGVLLEAMNLGDGANGRRTITWTQRTMSITCGDNRQAAERLQALCVMRGFRCNLSSYQAEGRNRWWTIHVRAAEWATIAGSGDRDNLIEGRPAQRSRFAIDECTPGEPVWCVENALGTLFVRRNGKVAIVGNCGRVLRPAEGKTHAIILDHVGNVLRHGLPDDDREWTLEGRKRKKRRKGEEEEAPGVRQCPACFCAHAPQPVCPECGHRYASESRTVREVEGELVEVDRALVARERRREQSQAQTLDDLIQLGRQRGYKNPHAWAQHVFASRRRKQLENWDLDPETKRQWAAARGQQHG